jgi:hypothetical protein
MIFLRGSLKMGITNKNDSANSAAGSKKPVLTTIVVLGLSLATWLFFYLESLPLSLSETTVIVGGWLVVVLVGKWVWLGLLRRKSQTG